MHKIFRAQSWVIVAGLVFVAIVVGWSAQRLVRAVDGPKPLGELHAIADAPLPSQTAESTVAPVTPSSTVPAAPSPSATPTLSSPSPTPTSNPGQTATLTPTPSAPTPPAPAELAPAVEIAMQHALEQQGKVFLEALQRGDTGAVQSMLGARCQGTDVAALVAGRQAEIGQQAGVPIAEITPLTTYVGHLDAAAGEAHTILEWIAGGQRMTLASADGWLYEGGQWKDVTC